MNERQICSFINARFSEESYFKPISSYQEAEQLINKFRYAGGNFPTFEELFPEEYAFIGDVYYDSELEAEESAFTPIKEDIAILGSALIYKELNRIIYKERRKVMRISFKQYKKMLDNLKKEINKAETLIN